MKVRSKDKIRTKGGKQQCRNEIKLRYEWDKNDKRATELTGNALH